MWGPESLLPCGNIGICHYGNRTWVCQLGCTPLYLLSHRTGSVFIFEKLILSQREDMVVENVVEEHEKTVLRLLQSQNGGGKRWSHLTIEWRRRGRTPGLDSSGPEKEEPERRTRKRQRKKKEQQGIQYLCEGQTHAEGKIRMEGVFQSQTLCTWTSRVPGEKQASGNIAGTKETQAKSFCRGQKSVW